VHHHFRDRLCGRRRPELRVGSERGLAGGSPDDLINSHQHFDHISGIRTYLHTGATIITQRKNITPRAQPCVPRTRAR